VPERTRPRLAFLGLGWIGRHRLAAVAESDVADIVALADPDPQALAAAAAIAPSAACGSRVDDLLDRRPDGVVIATPNALHAPQAIAALRAGAAVFCQKPLARTAAETHEILLAAQRADRRIGVDFSYRHTEALRRVHGLVREGALGEVFAVDLVFHNAYGPDKAWFNDPASAGGGCLMDLGIHLLDFLHWTFDGRVAHASSHLFASGVPVAMPPHGVVEDFAAAEVRLEGGPLARLACSWRLSAGVDARIEIAAYGTAGAAVFRNVNGSFYDFVAEHCRGTRVERLCGPPDDWGGRATVAWARDLAERGAGYDAAIERVFIVAETLDRLYDRHEPRCDPSERASEVGGRT
jgi:predicted dehydrogenase